MKIELSNTIIRAYSKKDQRISFHLRTHCFVHSKTSFRFSAYLKKISSWFVLPDGLPIEFDVISYPMHSGIPFNGKFVASELHLETISPLKKVGTSLADLYIRFHFSFTGHPSEVPEEHKYSAIVKRIQN